MITSPSHAQYSRILRRCYSIVPGMLLVTTLSAQVNSIRNKNLEISINSHLQTQISSRHTGDKPLTTGFTYSEYLDTKYYRAEDFIFTKKEKTVSMMRPVPERFGVFSEPANLTGWKKFFL